MTGQPHHTSAVHAAAIYRTEAELVEAAVPFLTEGAARDDALILAAGARTAATLLPHLPPTATVTQLEGAYERPATTIRHLLELLRARPPAAGRVRVVGQVPDHATQTGWWPWARYEAAANALFGEFAFSGLCLYDARSTPPAVVDDVECTHDTLVAGPEWQPSPRYVDPVTFLRRPAAPGPDSLPSSPPAVELHDPTPAQARRALQQLAVGRMLDAATTDTVVFGVSEAVANAHLHGTPPVEVRVWVGADRLVATVHDTGPGPQDPYAGLVKARGADEVGGYGLWATHQLCDEVVHLRDDRGFTLRLTVRRR